MNTRTSAGGSTSRQPLMPPYHIIHALHTSYISNQVFLGLPLGLARFSTFIYIHFLAQSFFLSSPHDQTIQLVSLQNSSHKSLESHVWRDSKLFPNYLFLAGDRSCCGKRSTSWQKRRERQLIRTWVKVRFTLWRPRSIGCKSDTPSSRNNRKGWSRIWKSLSSSNILRLTAISL